MTSAIQWQYQSSWWSMELLAAKESANFSKIGGNQNWANGWLTTLSGTFMSCLLTWLAGAVSQSEIRILFS